MTEHAASADDDFPEPRGEGSVEVVGTAHVSEQSVEEVESTIEARRPDIVAVELDEGRYQQMQGETPDDLEASDLLRGNTVFQFLAYWMLSYVQARLGDRFDVEPGADMKAAIDSAEELGLGLALVDRDIQTTVQRFWARLGFVAKLRLLGNLTLALGPPWMVGLSLGATGGVILGFVAATFAAGPLGFATADFVAVMGPTTVAVVGGLLGGSIAGLGLWAVLDPYIDRALVPVAGEGTVNTAATRGGLCLVAGTLAGAGIAFSGGLAVGPVSVSTGQLVSLGGVILQNGTGMVGGAVALGSLGTAVGLVAGLFLPDTEDIEEFDIEQMTDTDVVSAMMEEFRQFSPGGAEALIDERDAFIAHRLVELRDRGYHVVAIVGAGHREGIERYLDHPEELPPMSSLIGTKSGRRVSLYQVVGYAIGVVFLVFFGLLILGGASQAVLLELFLALVVVNAVCAGGLAKLAGAHWTSAAAAGVFGWLTSLFPLLAAGWFAGYVELRYISVNVGDIGTLNEILGDQEAPITELVARLRAVPLFRLILVVAMANVGSAVASYVVFPALLPYLAADIGGMGGVTELLWNGIRSGARLILGPL